MNPEQKEALRKKMDKLYEEYRCSPERAERVEAERQKQIASYIRDKDKHFTI